MNTKQLIALWLGGLAVAALLTLRVGTAGEAGAICIVCALLIYSFGSHPNAGKKKVLLTVGIVAACGATVFYAHKTVRTREVYRRQEQAAAASEQKLRILVDGYPINPDSIKLSGVGYAPSIQSLRGRVQNNSRNTLAGLTIHVTFLDRRRVLDEEDCKVGLGGGNPSFALPPGQTQGFEADCPAVIDAPHGEHVFLRAHITAAVTSAP